MLHLERRLKDEGITIVAPTGEKLKLFVTKITPTKVMLSFAEFEKFGVWRTETFKRIKGEKAEKGKAQLDDNGAELDEKIYDCQMDY